MKIYKIKFRKSSNPKIWESDFTEARVREIKNRFGRFEPVKKFLETVWPFETIKITDHYWFETDKI